MMLEKITPNFSKKEFACKCGCGFAEINIALVNRLQVVRDIVGLPIRMLSGCRCKKHNEEVGGAKESQHALGNAGDWTIDNYPMKSVALMLNEWSGGFHFYEEKNFIHTDVGARRRWT